MASVHHLIHVLVRLGSLIWGRVGLVGTVKDLLGGGGGEGVGTSSITSFGEATRMLIPF